MPTAAALADNNAFSQLSRPGPLTSSDAVHLRESPVVSPPPRL